MKTLKIKISILVLLLVTLLSCNKDNEIINNENSLSDAIKVIH